MTNKTGLVILFVTVLSGAPNENRADRADNLLVSKLSHETNHGRVFQNWRLSALSALQRSMLDVSSRSSRGGSFQRWRRPAVHRSRSSHPTGACCSTCAA